MKISDKAFKSVISEAVNEYSMLEKKRRRNKKKHPEDHNDNKKKDDKGMVSKSDQQIIRRKVKNKNGRNIINVTAIADELPYTQSMINRCINGKVHNGSQGEVEYSMPTDMARGIEAYLKRQVAEGKVSKIINEVLNENFGEQRYMSDEDIANQYQDFKVTHFEINPSRYGNGWTGTIEIEFPNADEVDFDSSVVDNFIVYDHEGTRVGFDNWYPDEVANQLKEMIRKAINQKIQAGELNEFAHGDIN